MILFFDGVDGTGKSTLIRHLQGQPTQPGGPRFVMAPPLWTYLDQITAPDQFEGWVTSTPGAEIADALLSAGHRRLTWLADTAAERGDGDVVSVDRGPKTVLCSARAHLVTGHAATHQTKSPEALLDRHELRLAAALAALAARDACLSVELRLPPGPPGLALALKRLSPLELVSPAYTTYLEVFIAKMAPVISWSGLPVLTLDAGDSVAGNVGAIRRAAGLAVPNQNTAETAFGV